VANSLSRHLINSPMPPQLEKDPDGGVALIIQNDSPGTDKEVNWLPAPKGPFMMAMRTGRWDEVLGLAAARVGRPAASDGG
jgi:hypothetical protein